MITNLIELFIWKLILNHLIRNNCSEFLNRLLDSYFFMLTLRSDYLELCFWVVASKIISILSNITEIPVAFKPDWVHMPSLTLTSKLPLEPRNCMFIINVNYTQGKRL